MHLEIEMQEPDEPGPSSRGRFLSLLNVLAKNSHE